MPVPPIHDANRTKGTLRHWSRKGARLEGVVVGHPRFGDGAHITTSIVQRAWVREDGVRVVGCLNQAFILDGAGTDDDEKWLRRIIKRTAEKRASGGVM